MSSGDFSADVKLCDPLPSTSAHTTILRKAVGSIAKVWKKENFVFWREHHKVLNRNVCVFPPLEANATCILLLVL